MKFFTYISIFLTLSPQAFALSVRNISPANIAASTVTISGTGPKCFSVNDPTLVVDCNLNRVGISTASPSTNLDVNGNAQFGSGGTKSTFSTTGTLSMAAAASIQSALYSPLAGNGNGISITANAGAAAPAGGITLTGGTGSSSNGSGGAISLNSGSASGNNVYSGDITLSAAGANSSALGGGNISITAGNGGAAASGGYINLAAGNGALANAGYIVFKTSGTERMRLTQDGGLGINDASPDAQLDIISTAAPTGFILSISSQNDTTGNIVSVLGNGNIGIGVINPAAPLEVFKTLNNGRVHAIDINSAASGTGAGSALSFMNSGALDAVIYSSYTGTAFSMVLGTQNFESTMQLVNGGVIISTLTIGVTQPPDSQALCIKSGVLGHCTGLVGAGGGCTCVAP